MYAEIIPYGASFGTETLTYFVGDSFHWKLKIWQIVKIPYGKKEIFWVVASIAITNNFHKDTKSLKEIIEIINPTCVLAEYQIHALLRLSRKYILTLHKVLAIFLPTPLLRRLQKYNFPLKFGENLPQKPIIHERENEIFFSKNEIISLERVLKEAQKRTIIIVPDDIFLFQWEEEYKKIFYEKYPNIAFYPNDITDVRRSKNWIEIANGESEIIIWTRRVLYYNLLRYDEIFYIEDSFARQYFHYPVQLQHNDMLAHLVESGLFRIKIFTSIPQLKTLSQFHFFKLHNI